jgi:hypothetical protein
VATTSGVLTMLRPMWRTRRSSCDAGVEEHANVATTSGALTMLRPMWLH